MLVDGWVADVESGSLGDDYEAVVTGGVEVKLVAGFVAVRGDGPELFIGDLGAHATTEGHETGGLAVNDGERWLATVVVKHEFWRGGGAAP